MRKLTFMAAVAAGLATVLSGFPTSSSLADGVVTAQHQFTVSKQGMKDFFDAFTKKTGIEVEDSPVGHEDYKTVILVRASGNNLPDIFSYAAGARPQYMVDGNHVAPLDDIWAEAGLDSIISKAVADGSSVYDGKRYFMPISFHYAGMFYNPKVMEKAGIDEMPSTWDELLATCGKLRALDIDPIAMGSKPRWPAQFWFDYLLLGTAGPDYRRALMTGDASYTDDEVKRVMNMWKDLMDAECFSPNSNAKEWTDAADELSRGEAAMTLMGTWITGYWNRNGLTPVEDYDFFPFPRVDEDVPVSAVGPVNGFLMAANSPNQKAAGQLLAFMASDPEMQANWISIEGSLSPNLEVDPSVYTPIQRKALETVNAADNFAFNYDLATPPPVAEVGLDMFAEFVNDPSYIDRLLEKVERAAKDGFSQ